MAADHATDFYGWATETAWKIRSGKLDEVNLEQVAEEIERIKRLLAKNPRGFPTPCPYSPSEVLPNA